MPYSRISLPLTVIAAIRVLLMPAVTVGALIGSANFFDAKFTNAYVALAIIAALLTWIFIGKEEPHRSGLQSGGLTVAGHVGFGWIAVIGVLLLIGYATKSSGVFSRRALFAWFTLTPPLLVIASLALRQCMRLVLTASRSARVVAIVGANRLSLELARAIGERPELGLKLRCFFDDGAGACLARAQGYEVCGDLAAIGPYVNRTRVDVVFVALPVESQKTQDLLKALRDTTTSVYLIPDISLFDLIQAQSTDIEGVPVIALCETPLHGARGIVKRATDIVFASLLLLIAAPAMLAIAIAVKVTSPGDVLFKQDRYGLDGERIVVYKFRTMTVCENGDCVVQAKRDDERVTRIGRFLRRTSLDELPQLINVLQGRMSLVGPRPHAVAHNEEYRKLISGYMVRHKMTPGITGLAQVNGCRGETSTVEEMRRRIEYDLDYMRHWCWLLDIKIILRTFVLLFFDKHAY